MSCLTPDVMAQAQPRFAAALPQRDASEAESAKAVIWFVLHGKLPHQKRRFDHLKCEFGTTKNRDATYDERIWVCLKTCVYPTYPHLMATKMCDIISIDLDINGDQS